MLCGGASATKPATSETQKIADEVRGTGTARPRGPGRLPQGLSPAWACWGLPCAPHGAGVAACRDRYREKHTL